MLTTEITSAAWDELKQLKQLAYDHGKKLGLQLHIPRKRSFSKTRRERRLYNLRSSWAYDERGNIKPDYERWENEGPINEIAPLLPPGDIQPGAGGNKPGQGFWTSTAERVGTDTYTSDWNNWVLDNMPDWWSSRGHIYSVKSGALVLPLNTNNDAQRIADVLHDIGRAANWREQGIDTKLGVEFGLQRAFPWNAIARHFDGVHHLGRSDFSYMMQFTYGWDAESTVWFNTGVLQYRGEVAVQSRSEEDSEND